ncbi:MAG: recombinase family protein [Chloroflexi bacterium]|nr:recombinase family protein [Chloroflexota bacterium]
MYHFAETEEDHARRLGQSRRFTRIRRRALLRKLEGQSPEQIRREMGESNCPYEVAEASIPELMNDLFVVLRGKTLVPAGEPLKPRFIREMERMGETVNPGAMFYYGGDKEERARMGEPIGSKLPFGYRQSRNGGVEIVPEEADLVRYVFYEYGIVGRSLPEIARDLPHLYPEIQRKWTGDTLREMIRNPFYAGYILYRGAEERQRGDRRNRGRLYPGKHPAIVSWDEFVAAQDTRVRLATKNPDALWECPWEGAPEE